MPRTYRKNIVRTLKSSRGRFLSIFSIVTLGVGFLAGLNASPLDMKESMERYMDDANFYDLRVVSSMGLSDGDVEALQNVEGVRNAQPGYSADLLVNAEDDVLVTRLLSLPPDDRRLRLWSERRQEFEKAFTLFSQGARSWLLARRLADTLADSAPGMLPRELLVDQRRALFGSPMFGGGLSEQLLNDLEALV